MKIGLLLAAVLVAGCAQLKQGQLQPVLPEADGAYFTTCSGSVEDWGSCNRKARNLCTKGYDVLHKHENPVGGRREMRFTCNK